MLTKLLIICIQGLCIKTVHFYSNKVLAQLKGNNSSQAIKLIVPATNSLAVMYSASGAIKKSTELLISNLPRLEK